MISCKKADQSMNSRHSAEFKGRKLLTLVGLLCLCPISYTVSAQDDMNVVYQTIALEAGGESPEGQVAVAEVIRNRARDRRQSYQKVVTAPYQFSCWNGPHRKLSDVELKNAHSAWDRSVSTNITKGACHYHTKSVHPKWSKGRTPAAVIGNHLFFAGIK